MKKVALVAATLALAGSAHAADLALKTKAPPLVVAPFSWTGLYIGVNAGGASGQDDMTMTDALGRTFTGNHSTAGWLAGGTVGYNYQFAPNWVVGLEGDFDGADINGSAACTAIAGLTCQSKLSDFATARGRLGYADGRVLVYGTGGGAWARDNQQFNDGPLGPFSNTSTRTGWVAGGGVEWAAWGPLSFKLEYLRYDFGSASNNLVGVAGSYFPATTKENGNIVRVGLNWKIWP